MKKLLILFICFGFSLSTNSQSTSYEKITFLNSDYLKTKMAYFTINKNNEILGDGERMIKELINNAQFVTLGEMHNSKKVSILTKALMPYLKTANFNHFAIEVGPNSANKLSQLSTPASNTILKLREFNTKYTLAHENETVGPIPFFSGIEDAEFLQEARSNKMQLWGIDQEFYFSPFFLIDELMEISKNAANYNQLQRLQKQAVQIIYKHFLDEVSGKNEGAYNFISKDKNVNLFFDTFDKNNSQVQNIIRDLQTSWDIYIRWRDDSHVDRISYMRNNFIKNYKRASKNEKLPKVFTKIGGLHATKLISNGAYDIGQLTEEIAKENGTVSTSINTWKPYYKKNDSIINNFEVHKSAFKRLKIFTDFAHKEKWAIINLKAIRNDIINGKVKLPTNGDYHKLKKLIDGYDYQIILPIDEDITQNRDQ